MRAVRAASIERSQGTLHSCAMSGVRRRCFLGGVALFACLMVAPPSRAAFEVADESWEGLSELLRIARNRVGKGRVRLVATLNYTTLSPTDAVLVLHPEASLDFRQLTAYLQSGGRLALLDDYGTGAEFLEQFGIRRVRAPLKPAFSLRQNVDLPIAVPAVEAGEREHRHPITRNLDHVVTNHPQALEHPGLTPVLVIRAVGERDATLALTGVIAERGRLFVMADPSVFINLMMRYPGNRQLAEGLLDYLVEPQGGQKRGNLYIVVNRFSQSGSFGDTDGLAASLRGWLRDLRERFGRLRSEGLPDNGFRVLGLLAVAAFGYWLWSIAGRRYRAFQPRYALPTPLVLQGGVAGRTALLAAPTTHRALPVLELQSALVEGLTEELSLPERLSSQALVQEIAKRSALSPESLMELRDLLGQFRQIETRFVSSRPVHLSDRKLESWRQLVLRLLGEASSRRESG